MPSVSVVVPTHERAEFVAGAIETALDQTYDDLEVVVVDDGSTDGTPERLATYADDDRVRVPRNGTNRGIASFRNRGIDAARGEYVCAPDDDRWHPEKAHKEVAVMEELGDDYCGVYTGAVLVRDGRVVGRDMARVRGDIYEEVLAESALTPHSSHMVCRECLEEIGEFDESFPCGVDWKIAVRLAREWKFEFIPEELVERRLHGDNVSGSGAARVMPRELLWEKYGDEISRITRRNGCSRRIGRGAICPMISGGLLLLRRRRDSGSCCTVTRVRDEYLFAYPCYSDKLV